MSGRDPRDSLIGLGEQIVQRATDAGADVAEVMVSEGVHLSAKIRLGEPELVEEAASKVIGLRVMRGQQVAVTSTSDFTPEGMQRFVEDALDLAALAQPDPFAGPPDPRLLSTPDLHPDLDLFDPTVDDIDADMALDLAKRGEAAAMATDERLTNSEGSSVTRVSGASALVTSGGFRGATRGTYVSLVVSPVADDTEGKKRSGYYWSARRHFSALETPEAVGQEAAKRTVAKLGARKIDTQEVPVVFDPDAGRGILKLLASCVVGGAVWRKASYLVGREGQRVASDLVTVVDDPLLPRGPGSRPFDGDGLRCRSNLVVDKGVLKTFLLDTYSSRKLKTQSTGSASRGAGAGVSATTSNFILQPGDVAPDELLANTPRALYVTDMMGFGFNAVTGDFSRGASGFWVEDGQKAFPVSEVTISLNLDKLLQRIDAVGNDLDLRAAVASPTFRVSSMTIAGR